MVDKTTMVSDVFSEFYNVLNSNATHITDSQGNTVSLRSSNGNYWYGAYPDTSLIEDKSKYPIGVLDTPTFNQSQEGLNFDEADFTVDISVFATRAEHAPKLAEKALDAIRSNLSEFEDADLYHFRTQESSQEVIVGDRGDLKIHRYTIPVQFTFGLSA